MKIKLNENVYSQYTFFRIKNIIQTNHIFDIEYYTNVNPDKVIHEQVNVDKIYFDYALQRIQMVLMVVGRTLKGDTYCYIPETDKVYQFENDEYKEVKIKR